ncbi:MAG: RagB/SusD family nutrient uptake outer membrane protein [Saprospiraceae bacterium]|nr:RagB/SusD family nutrient uptake outer membrane protein [Saprospiraceae bacterium]
MKNFNLKKSVMIFGTIAFLFVSQSCKDVLKEDVISNIGNDYLNTAAGFNAAVNAAYSSLRAYYGSQQGLTFTEYGTDIYATGADGGYKGFHFYDTQLNSSVDWIASLWDELYRGINTCNAVIDRSKTITGVTDAVKNQRVAECRYLRGLYYFLLYMHWGGVDLRLTETLTPSKQTTRATDKAMFDAIIADLEAAYPALEAKKASSEYGRATKPACGHLLGYVYLTRNNTSSKGADDVNKAVTYLSDVVNGSYGFSLLPDFASVFDENNQVNNEVVWAVQYTTDPATNTPAADNNGNTGGNNLHLFFGMQYDVQAGMQRDVFYGRPFKRLRPTKYLIETAFADRTNDSRFKKSFRDTWLSNKAGTYSAFSLDNSKTGSLTYKTGDTTMLIVSNEMPKEERALRKYQVITPGFATTGGYFNEAIFYTLTKFFDTKRPDLTYTHGSRDYFVFRLADTKLLLAEAYLLAGKRAEALVQVNDVRKRAAFAGKEAAMTITDAQLSMDYIMEERARELCGEQIRWLDLKRWGKLVERVKLYNPQAAANIKDIHNLRPIPQAQIDRTEGGSTAFPQNPGY